MAAAENMQAIIDQALEVAREKSDEAKELIEAAIDAADVRPPQISSTYLSGGPKVVEPPVNIPMNATGLDSALYDSTYDRILTDLSGKFAGFFDEYFPNECDYLAKAQQWMCDVLDTGGTGIKPAVEDQIWQRDRARVLRDSARAEDDIVATFAARGFPLPPGAAAHAVGLVQQDARDKIAQASRDVAIKQAEIEIENIKFAVQQALDYRIKAIAAAGDYIRTLAIGPDIAMKLATSSADAQAKLISAASQYYNARISVASLDVELIKAFGSMRNTRNIAQGGINVEALKLKATTYSSVAESLAHQASAALNSLHASAQVAVQEEAA